MAVEQKHSVVARNTAEAAVRELLAKQKERLEVLEKERSKLKELLDAEGSDYQKFLAVRDEILRLNEAIPEQEKMLKEIGKAKVKLPSNGLCVA